MGQSTLLLSWVGLGLNYDRVGWFKKRTHVQVCRIVKIYERRDGKFHQLSNCSYIMASLKCRHGCMCVCICTPLCVYVCVCVWNSFIVMYSDLSVTGSFRVLVLCSFTLTFDSGVGSSPPPTSVDIISEAAL